MATRITVDGESSEIGMFPNLRAVQQAVGGYVEIVRFAPVRFGDELYAAMLVDEDGLMKRLEPNTQASQIACTWIVGSVVLLTMDEVKADWS